MVQGVSSTLPTQVCLTTGSAVTSYLQLSGTASTPPGTYPLRVVATLGSTHTALFSLSTQVTTFQVTSATGSAIVHNTGQEVQVTHTVPAGSVPANATCSSSDPNVTCRVISSSPGTVTLGIMAAAGAVHGTRVLKLNNGATTVHAAFADSLGSSGLPTITVQAGGSAHRDIDLPADCDMSIDGDSEPCDATVTHAPDWVSSFDGISALTVYADPPLSTPPGTYSYSMDLCGGYYDPENEYSCEIGGGVIDVEAAPPPPQCVPAVGIVLHGSTTNIAGTSPSVSAGQLVLLDSSILNSCNQTATQYSWTIDGSIASDWQGVGSDGRPNGSPPDRNSAGPPSAPVLSDQRVTFAWTDGGAGKNAGVKVTFADGSTATTSATFDINIPTSNATMRAATVHADHT